MHHLGQLAVRSGRGHLGQRLVDLAQVDVLRGGGRPVLVAGDRRDDGDLFGGEPAVGERGRHGRQVFQGPAGADQLPGRGRGQPGMPAQPGPHARLPIVLGRLGELALPDGAGDLRVESVLRPQQLPRAVEHLWPEDRLQVLAGQPVQGGLQIRERVTRTVRTHVRIVADRVTGDHLNPQVSRLSTVPSRPLRGVQSG